MTACKWAGTDQPRLLVGRHLIDCADEETCRGCQPCTTPHCRVCGVTHVLTTDACPGCLAEIRESLDEIERMCRALPTEVEHRGVEAEAFVLLGPVADPEAVGHMEASVWAGRIPPEYLETVDDELHPTFVAERWASVYREAFEHDEPAGRVVLVNELGYLRRNLTYMGTFEWVPFEDFARDLRRCVSHLESVLHDGEQIDRGAPCLTCHKPLTRAWGDGRRPDGWECKRCRQWSTEDQYRFAMKAHYIQEAEWLTDVDMTARTGVKSGTVRVWAQRELIAKRLDSGRIVYSVAEVVARRDEQSLAS